MRVDALLCRGAFCPGAEPAGYPCCARGVVQSEGWPTRHISREAFRFPHQWLSDTLLPLASGSIVGDQCWNRLRAGTSDTDRATHCFRRPCCAGSAQQDLGGFVLASLDEGTTE